MRPQPVRAEAPITVRAPEPAPAIRNPIVPVLNAIASSTLVEVPSIVAPAPLPEPALQAVAGNPVEISAPVVTETPRPLLAERMRAFVGSIGSSLRGFLSPMF